MGSVYSRKTSFTFRSKPSPRTPTVTAAINIVTLITDEFSHFFPVVAMSRSEAEGEKKIARRSFLKWTGTLALAGVAGVGLGYAADVRAKSNHGASPAASGSLTSSTTSAASGSDVASSVQTVTVTTTRTTSVTSAAGSGAQPATELPANGFSIFWITDTQFLSESNPALFRMATNWIVDNWSAYNGKMVIHTGDIVETGATQVQWQNADEAMSILLKNKIPYSWCAGNHDDLIGGEAASGWMGNVWAPAFDPSNIKPKLNALGYTTWASDYHNGMNTAVTFSANGWNFLVINVEWNGQPDVLEWVAGLLDDPLYADHKVIIAPHAYMDAYGEINDARWGPTLADFVTGLKGAMDAHSSNVFLSLNGHFATDQGYNTGTPINNRNQLMFDRQDCTDDPSCPTGRGVDFSDSTTPDGDKVGGSTVMILTFDMEKNQIAAKTYDVYKGRWRTGAYEQYTISAFSGNPVSPVHIVPGPISAVR